MSEEKTPGQLLHEALYSEYHHWGSLIESERATYEAAAKVAHDAIAAVPASPALTFTPVGYQGPAQHTYTTACAGFHAPGPCPTVIQPVNIVGLSGGSEGSA